LHFQCRIWIAIKRTDILAGSSNSTALIMCLITENMFCRTHLCLWEHKCSILLHKGHTVQENFTVVYVMYSNIIQALTIINTIMKCKTHSLESNCIKLLK
jgi:hypothetical protein